MTDEFEQQWLSDLPSDWAEKRADHLCIPYRVSVDPFVFGDCLVAHYSIPQVQETGGPCIEPASDIDSIKLVIDASTLLVSKLNPRKKTICIAERHPEYPTLASGEFVAIHSEEMDRRYAYYLWCSEKVTDRLSAIVQSVTRSHQRVNPADILKLPWKWPPLDTQRRIARFLDEKTARIDVLIDKKRALLDRLAEKRQALITRAVTKGLNDASLRPSGMEWLGDIPVHWEVLPLRRITSRVATGRTPPSTTTDYFTDGNLNWFTPGDFSTAIELHNSARKVTLEAIENGVCTLFPERTVFLVGIGATLGKVAVSTTTGSANQQINAILPDRDNDPYFMAYFLYGYRTEVRVTSNGNTLGILNQDGTKSLLMPVPPLSEQKEIASELASHDAREAEIVQHIGGSIGLLQDYRAALITAGVTGQLAELR